MRKHRHPHRNRVSARSAAEYRACPEEGGVLEAAAAMQATAKHRQMLKAEGEVEQARGALKASIFCGLVLGATPAASAKEAALKVLQLETIVITGGSWGPPADAAMIAEAIRLERERWNLPARDERPN